MNFTTDTNSVRADLFKPAGKWFETFTLKLPEKCDHERCDGIYNCWDLWTNYLKAFEALRACQLPEGWKLVILNPYNQNSHPIMLIGGTKGKL